MCDDDSSTNLIINYLPQTLTDDEFKSMFLSIGPLNSCRIIRDRATNYSYGFGFVDYEKADDAARAIETLNGLQLQNKRIKVAYSRNHDKVKNANLYFKNLPKEFTQEQLHSICQQYGNIVNVRILTNPMTGKSKGIGFVLYDTHDQAQSAQTALDGMVPEGSTENLVVKFADDNQSKMARYRPPVVMVNQYQQQAGWGGGYQGGAPMGGRGGFNGGGGAMGGPPAGAGGYGGPTRNQGRYNQRYNPFANANPGAMGGGGAQGMGQQGETVLFVFNIGPDTDERGLWQLFSPFGNVSKVNVIKDQAKNTGKGYGFVTMTTLAEAQAAINSLNGYRFYGKPLQVSIKTPK